MTLKDRLRRAGFKGELIAEAPMAPYTTWRIGGPAELLAHPVDRDDIMTTVRWAVAESVPWHVMGNGSNLLVRDRGVRGVVLRLHRTLDEIRFDAPEVFVGAGFSFPRLTRQAATHHLSGLEFGAGIPGTTGGALVMNAGWHQHEICNVVASVEFLDADGELLSLGRDECRFGYRTSRFRRSPGVVLSARLVMSPGDPGAIKERMATFAALRKERQPVTLPSCGSVFVQPEGDFAGRLIEQAGLKGRRSGGIEISTLHANFFVNTGGGTARDVLALVELAEQEVLGRFGVRLEREFDLW